MTQRDFEIKLGLLVMHSLADNLKPDDLIAAMESKLREELKLKKARRLDALSY